MDFATIIGLIVGVGGLLVGFILDKGALGALIQPSAALIVLGGTLGATLVSSRMKSFTSIGRYLKIAFFTKSKDPHETIDLLVEMAVTARREGILALEEQVDDFDDVFLKNGVRQIVDGVDPELVKEMLETEIAYIERRHEAGIGLFEAAGGFAPTMGIIGTVMGLVHVLGNLQDVTSLGPEIATAFIATLYGVASANVLWLPIANKLKTKSEDEILEREMTLEGILSVQAGENPNVLRQKLLSFLASSQRVKKRAKAGETDAETAEA
ncbi:flagellar motor protein [Alicyclobacillus fastidiosus]|uniref:Flagellar motor protein n=1 Tax=Alicyclobacillus fastidiosus TaxID=392011 RepID=A0ABV5AJ14_9BACL|nr:flagellar motor protein [Alicyclobacillus fastidiosus]WEH09367.1 flagellar motor protein [Alicyclobacillus fastidiosus]